MLQLRFHFGERDRDGSGDGPLDAAVMDACARRGVAAAALLRGVEGFGAKHLLRTDRLLSLSEDALLVAVAVGESAEIEALAEEVREMANGGLVALEGVEVVDGGAVGDRGARTTGTTTSPAEQVVVPVAGAPEDEGGGSGGAPADGEEGAQGDRDGSATGDAVRGAPDDGGGGASGDRAPNERTGGPRGGDPGDLVKATIWGPRTGAASPHLAAVAALHRHGALAATVLLGVDGVLEGERRRARFVASNRGVPAMTVAVGERAAIDAALAGHGGTAHLVTVEAVETFRRIATVSHHRDGAVVSSSRIARASHHGAGPVERNSVIDRGSHHGATRVALVTSEIAACDSGPLYVELIRRLRAEGATGATALRGVWGFRRGGEPHGDRVLVLQRDVPLVVETVDTAERAEQWRTIALELAGDQDIVYSQAITSTFAVK
jgi:PII-like signaling protein